MSWTTVGTREAKGSNETLDHLSPDVGDSNLLDVDCQSNCLHFCVVDGSGNELSSESFARCPSPGPTEHSNHFFWLFRYSLDPFTAFWDFLTSTPPKCTIESSPHKRWNLENEWVYQFTSYPWHRKAPRDFERSAGRQAGRLCAAAQAWVGVEDLWLWLSRLGYVKRIMFLVQYFGLPIHFGVNHFGPCGLMDHFASFHEIIWGGMMKLYYLQRRAGWLDQKSS